ncbi:hypothetical protein ACMFMG_004599 [Clarireedia jacksonii]
MALLAVMFTILAAPLAFFIWTAQSLYQSRSKAKATGLPYITRCVSPINPIWLLYGSSIVRTLQRLGLVNEKLSLIYEILQRRTDFRRNMEEMAVLDVYGKNLSTMDDQEWQQHRKMTAVTFTEKNNEQVWYQSLVQANGMLQYWTERAEQLVISTNKDTKVLTLNFLAAALFNKVYPFEGYVEEKRKGDAHDDSYQYRDSLSTILSSIIQIFIFGEEGLKSKWLPQTWRNAGKAMSGFRSYIIGLMDEQGAYLANGTNDNNHLVARLVRACEDDNPDSDSVEKHSDKKMTLTQEEIISNLFVYAFAGNDTTAVTITNLLIHLATNPETQTWISEEISHYLPDSNVESWHYETFFKLKRCSAVMSDPCTNETLLPDTSAHFLPWAWGQRVYPRKRFSQVELVAILAVLFRKYGVEVAVEGKNETMEKSRERAWKVSLVVDHQGTMLHEIVKPERVGLRWVKRTRKLENRLK